MILVDGKETRTMEFQNCFKSKIILIVKEEFIGLEYANLGKVTKIMQKSSVEKYSNTTSMGFWMVSNKKNRVLTL